MELTEEQKKNLLSVKDKVKILPQIEKVEKELLAIVRKKEKLEEKLLILFGLLNGNTSDEKKKDLSENPKTIKESKDRYSQGNENNLLS